MASNSLTIKLGDNYPPLVSVLKSTQLTGEMLPIDLTNAKEVKIRLKKVGGGPEFTGLCSILTPKVNGEVEFNWGAEGGGLVTTTVGEYHVEFKIIWTTPAGGKETVPNEKTDILTVEEAV